MEKKLINCMSLKIKSIKEKINLDYLLKSKCLLIAKLLLVLLVW